MLVNTCLNGKTIKKSKKVIPVEVKRTRKKKKSREQFSFGRGRLLIIRRGPSRGNLWCWQGSIYCPAWLFGHLCFNKKPWVCLCFVYFSVCLSYFTIEEVFFFFTKVISLQKCRDFCRNFGSQETNELVDSLDWFKKAEAWLSNVECWVQHRIFKSRGIARLHQLLELGTIEEREMGP